MTTIHPRNKTIAGLAGLVLLSAPLAACAEEDDTSAASSSESTSSSELPLDYQAAVTDLSQTQGSTTAVDLDPGFLDALMSLNVTPSPFEDATLDGSTLTFPITGGNVELFEPGTVPDYVIGQVQHENSGLNLEAGGTTVTVGNFIVDPVVSQVYGDVVVDDTVAATNIPIFRLDGSTLEEPALDGGSEVVLEGSGVFLSEGAASLLNDTFGIDALSGDVKVGVATITVQTG